MYQSLIINEFLSLKKPSHNGRKSIHSFVCRMKYSSLIVIYSYVLHTNQICVYIFNSKKITKKMYYTKLYEFIGVLGCTVCACM